MASTSAPRIAGLLDLFGLYPDQSWNAAMAIADSGEGPDSFLKNWLVDKWKPQELATQRYIADAGVRGSQAKGSSDIQEAQLRNQSAEKIAGMNQETQLANQRIQQALEAMKNQATLGSAGIHAGATIDAAKLSNQGRIEAARLAAEPKMTAGQLLKGVDLPMMDFVTKLTGGDKAAAFGILTSQNPATDLQEILRRNQALANQPKQPGIFSRMYNWFGGGQ